LRSCPLNIYLLKEKRKELGELKKKGYKSLQFSQRFKLAQSHEEYISAYTYLCRYAHNDIVSLEGRHLTTNENGDVELSIFKEIGAENETHFIDISNSILLMASGRTHNFFDSKGVDEIDIMLQELNTLRARWP
jgi:methyl coenzyme M reductase gamma subunit